MMFKEYDLFGSTYVTTQESEVIDMLHYKGFSAHFVYDNTTPAAGAFTAQVTDICTKNGHGFVAGLKVRVSTDGVLPSGLVAGTDYYIIVGSANTFALSDTLAHALAGTDIVNIGDAGTGTHTITPTALAGSLAKVQGSNYPTTGFTDLANLTGNITADGSALYNQYGVFYRYIKCYFTATAGQVLLTCKVVLKGE